LQHAVAHHAARAGRHALLVERRTGERLALVRTLLDVHPARKHLLAEAAGKEARFAVQAAATRCGDETAQQHRRLRRLEQHRRLARADLARAEPRQCARAGVAAQRLSPCQLRRCPHRAVPVVALHAALVLGDHRQGERVARGRKTAHEAKAVGEHELRMLRRHRCPFRIADLGRQRKGRGLASARDADRFLGGERPGMVEVEIGHIACEQFGFGQAGAVIYRGVARNGQRRRHRLFQRRCGKIRSAGVPAMRAGPLAEVHAHPDTLVAIVLDGVHSALAHCHRQALSFRHVAFAGAGTQPLCMRKRIRRELLQLRLRVAEAAAVFHGALS